MRPIDVEVPDVRRCPSAVTMRGSPTSTTCWREVADTYGDRGGACSRGRPSGATTRRSPPTSDYRWDGVHVYKPGAELIYDEGRPAAPPLAATP